MAYEGQDSCLPVSEVESFTRQVILCHTRGQNKDLYMDVIARQISIYKKVLHNFLKGPKVKWLALGIEYFITDVSEQRQENH